MRSFLQSAADLWLSFYHCDGLRMDAVSNALYWQGDPSRGVNAGGVEFLRGLNSGLHRRHPGAVLTAEDSSTFLKVTAPVEYGGLGFDYKWDMGWMHDTLDFFAAPPEVRGRLRGQLAFSMQYFSSELYLLPLSHDEVVHGTKTILDQLPGGYEEKFAQCRALFALSLIHILQIGDQRFGQLPVEQPAAVCPPPPRAGVQLVNLHRPVIAPSRRGPPAGRGAGGGQPYQARGTAGPQLGAQRKGIGPVHRAAVRSQDAVFIQAPLLCGGVGPVSYTHLDVYKRQPAAPTARGRSGWGSFS